MYNTRTGFLDIRPHAMKQKQSAQELEFRAVAATRPRSSSMTTPACEAMAMLARRGLRPEISEGDYPFPRGMDEQTADRISEWLGHYAFRLFLRGAIRKSEGFMPAATTRYLTRTQAKDYADVLVALDLAEKTSRSRYRLKWAARSFGGTLEWYVGRELNRRYGFDVATGVKLRVPGGGGDLDVVAAAEGKLLYVELKSSPPKNLSESEMSAFCDRLGLVHPDVALFVVDTALRLTDKVLPMLVREFVRRDRSASRPERIAAQLWAMTPHVYIVNGQRDLMANVGKAVAAGLLALSPRPY
jgi:hypothetical protein